MSQDARTPAILARAVVNVPRAAGREALVRDVTAHPRPARRQPRPRHSRDARAALAVLVFGLAAFTWIVRALGFICAAPRGPRCPTHRACPRPEGRSFRGAVAGGPGPRSRPTPGVRASGPGRDDVHGPRAVGEDRTSSGRGARP